MVIDISNTAGHNDSSYQLPLIISYWIRNLKINAIKIHHLVHLIENDTNERRIKFYPLVRPSSEQRFEIPIWDSSEEEEVRNAIWFATYSWPNQGVFAPTSYVCMQYACTVCTLCIETSQWNWRRQMHFLDNPFHAVCRTKKHGTVIAGQMCYRCVLPPGMGYESGQNGYRRAAFV